MSVSIRAAVGWSLVFVLLRLAWVVGLLLVGSLLCTILAVSESLALAATVYGLFWGRVDTSVSALAVPVCYAVASLLIPSGRLVVPWAPAALV